MELICNYVCTSVIIVTVLNNILNQIKPVKLNQLLCIKEFLLI